MKKVGVGVIGGSGYIGGELLRYLCVHPGVSILWVTANSKAGRPVREILPNLDGFVEHDYMKLEELPDDLGGARVVFVAVPHNKSQEIIPALASKHPDVVFIDMGGDFRTPDPLGYERYYGRAHAAPEWLERFVYGLTEWQRERLDTGAKLIANPGCFASSLGLGLAPLARAGHLRGDVFATGVTGSSGSGNSPKPTTHHPERATNFRSYKPLGHQHTLEVEGFLGTLTSDALRVQFVPQSGPFVRGIFTTIFVPAVDVERLADIYEESYGDEALISVGRGTPELRWIQGTPRTHIGLASKRGTGVVFVVLDNLGKGAAGQAVQNMNRCLGLPETSGLTGLPGGFV